MISFKQLHYGEEPLLLGNVWNVESARVYEKLGYKALATSSSAVAHSLGYEDGEQMTFEEYFYIIKRIKASVAIPLSVDLESGYGTENNSIVSNIIKLIETGISGINIEDTKVIDGTRRLTDKNVLYEKLNDIFIKLGEDRDKIFINIRTDPFLLNIENALEETLARIQLFEKLNADGIFIPGITAKNDIRTVTASTSLPVNVMGMRNLPDFDQLKELGVKRITSGAFIYAHIYREMEKSGQAIIDEKSFSKLFI
ncbi:MULTISPECIES: isocitrate lyase/PEP mutase family protein [Chryseobacterium]|uniref:2-methylisocitrate lyase-like PEP mutase family enzyme n=1 Tax=Chryseobacterium camelliae TaxID=1265445 RepID=A0ABU0TEQ1_9FLAO|nr:MULTISPECIES: isocitrate lyase/phosphoenolpyruvate mutase family protein [Chryseobacterium]MDT3406654.1 2-methylisocitrate lyase-like PEP mutase family enzyme [Pseudacidovorax intermedius]MDQ1095548.1 2-methylisocitrate lyase-like PEP mutase family enzyme [Chryseobacterium camelliae]MDQ1099486.1 2-methylisocitrate lyase-like PEP mutase family enzyme [Chryseobacterium sp. SORGH_AS_1048]MDR6086833.1 2-methylisocitrate lyase-like PEP mutase family enzyme [Chryseobacterium sp. SORGH_AS_0909]MDR